MVPEPTATGYAAASEWANVLSRFPPPTLTVLWLRMTVPQELVEEIIVHSRHDNQVLQNCSLVAKSWAYPSQKLLYTRIRITPSTYKTWQEIASPRSANLLRHVHSLTCHQFESLHDLHDDYLKSFHHLQHLSLDQVHNVDLDTVNLFPAFQNTLSSLNLFRVSFTVDAFINLIGHFPKLEELHVNSPTFESGPQTVPPPSTPPRGALRLFVLPAKSADILLPALCELELEYHELEIYEVLGRSTSHVPSLVSTCGKTLTHLKLGPHDARSLRTLENLSELRELAFTLSLLPPEEVALISTITSTNIQKIVFRPFVQRDLGDRFWLSLDTELSGLVDRLRASGYQHTLELALRHDTSFAETVSNAGPDGFLPKFREKGRVTVVDTTNEKVLYCSDG